MSGAGDNRLAVLAAEIRIAHAGVIAAATVAAERAIEAGKALTEAKELVPHGQWLPWLKEHCQLSVRTAQVYMKIVRLGLTAPVVADVGLKGAADVICVIHDPGYNPFHHCDEEQQRQWLLFILFGQHPSHVEWILQRQFTTPDEWLGPEGAAFRRPYGWRGLQRSVTLELPGPHSSRNTRTSRRPRSRPRWPSSLLPAANSGPASAAAPNTQRLRICPSLPLVTRWETSRTASVRWQRRATPMYCATASPLSPRS